ncbi:MAG: hypothetical protein Q4D16_12640 [Eubacteriales bacterium]|nr:hypothetical protein [Eubacteriales bacterium]
MPRQKKKSYDYSSVMADLMDTVVSAYAVSPKPSLQTIADQLEFNLIKVRKLLITAEVYESDIADEVLQLHREGKSVSEIMSATGLSRPSVNSYLPYTKFPYKADEIFVTAKKLRKYRQKKAAVEGHYGF